VCIGNLRTIDVPYRKSLKVKSPANLDMLKGIKSVDYSKAIRPLISVKRGKRPYLFYLATELSAMPVFSQLMPTL
jgi:hypothetical protein